jgi:hypothetical protein
MLPLIEMLRDEVAWFRAYQPGRLKPSASSRQPAAGALFLLFAQANGSAIVISR